MVAMEGQGIRCRPAGVGTVGVRRDHVVADSIATAIVSIPQGAVPHLGRTAEMGLGEMRLADIDVAGPLLDSIPRKLNRGMSVPHLPSGDGGTIGGLAPLRMVSANHRGREGIGGQRAWLAFS